MPTFNLQPILFPRCFEDEETGCRACGDNARVEYEQCRQSYYLKKQTELLESQQSGDQQTYQENVAEKEEIITKKEQNIVEKEQVVKELELKNQGLQELLEKQNKQVNELIQGIEQQSQEVNTLTSSLKDANSLNVGLTVISVAFLVCLMLFLVKKKMKKL